MEFLSTLAHLFTGSDSRNRQRIEKEKERKARRASRETERLEKLKQRETRKTDTGRQKGRS